VHLILWAKIHPIANTFNLIARSVTAQQPMHSTTTTNYVQYTTCKMMTKRGSDDIDKIPRRSSREAKKTRHYQNQKFFPNGELEVTLVEQCGMNQPNPGQALKLSAEEKHLGDLGE
jgi:hypothetical protein